MRRKPYYHSFSFIFNTIDHASKFLQRISYNGKKKQFLNKTAANLKQMHHTFGTKLYIIEFTFLKKDY